MNIIAVEVGELMRPVNNFPTYPPSVFPLLMQSQEEPVDLEPEDDGPQSAEFTALSEQITGLPFESLASIDDDVPTEYFATIDWTRPKLEILHDIRQQDEDGKDSEDDSDSDNDEQSSVSSSPTTLAESLAALAVLKKFFLEQSMVDGLMAAQNLNEDMFKCVADDIW